MIGYPVDVQEIAIIQTSSSFVLRLISASVVLSSLTALLVRCVAWNWRYELFWLDV